MKTTWRKQIAKEMAEHGETWADVDASIIKARPLRAWETLDAEEIAERKASESFDALFHDGFGSACGAHFTVWTARRVYFPVVYDGSEWCGSVPRNPSDEAVAHVGGQ